MKNRDRAAGLLPHKTMGGGIPHRTNEYRIASGYDSDIYFGDPVVATGDGANVQKAAPGGPITGVFRGCSYVDETGEPRYSQFWPAGTKVLSGTVATCLVIDDPDMAFEIQASGDFSEADVRAGANIVYPEGDESRWLGISGAQLDSSTYGTSGNLQFKIIGLSNRLDGNDYGEHAKVLVKINRSELAAPAPLV